MNQLARSIKRQEPQMKLKNEKVVDQVRLVKKWWKELDPNGVKSVDKSKFAPDTAHPNRQHNKISK